MRHWWWLAAAGIGRSQHFELKSTPVPSSHALATIARFFVWVDGDPVGSYLPSVGWGFWDSHSPHQPKILARQVSYHFSNDTKRWPETTDEMMDLDLQLVVMEYGAFWNIFVPHQKSHHFCCTKTDIAIGACSAPGFLLPESLKERTFVASVPINRSYGTVIDAEMIIKKSGIYYAVLVNCGKDLSGGQLSGAMVSRGAYGYLSGVDTPKLQLYAIGSVVCLALSILWIIWCLRYRRQIILLHTYVGLVIAVSFLEQILFYVDLSWANATTPPSWKTKILALIASVAKNVLTAGLVLITCLGLNITKPSLDPSTKAKVIASIIVLALLDTERQIATQFHISYDFSVALLFLCALPITVLYTIGFMWSFRSLSALLEELRTRRQTAKLRQMTRYRFVLMVAAVLFVCSTVAESYVLSMDVQVAWPFEWIFTDALPVFLYMFILVLTALIWRPHRSSKYYSYNVQLGDEEELEVDADHKQAEGGQGTWQSSNIEIRPWGDVEIEDEDVSAETFKPFEVTSSKN